MNGAMEPAKMTPELKAALEALPICDAPECGRRGTWGIVTRCCRHVMFACNGHTRQTRRYYAGLRMLTCPWCHAQNTPEKLIEWNQI